MVARNITLDLNKTSIQLTLLITVIGVIVIITDHDIKSLQLLCVVVMKLTILVKPVG